MNVKVINIDKSHEPILSFLFPTYSIVESSAVSNKFITHRDIKSKAERDSLEVKYNDCIFISTQIFDEFWDEEIIKSKVIEFSRVNFKNRKTKLETNKATFVDDCIKFMFCMSETEEEQSINEMFENFGSAIFVKEFLKLSTKVPYQVLISSLFTFVQKILSSENSIFYKKKSILFGEKIKRNLSKAVDEYNLRDKDNYGLSQVKFFVDLYQ